MEKGGRVAATSDSNNKLEKAWKKVKILWEKKEEADLEKTVLVAASVIAAMAYQAAISPPGGVASVDAEVRGPPGPYRYPDDRDYVIKPSDSLLTYFYSSLSHVFWISNTISLIASLFVIFLFLSGMSLRRTVVIWFLRGAMWVTLTSMTVAYMCAVLATTPHNGFDDMGVTHLIIFVALCSWLLLMTVSVSVIVYRCKRIKGKNTSTSTGKHPIIIPTPNTNIV